MSKNAERVEPLRLKIKTERYSAPPYFLNTTVVGATTPPAIYVHNLVSKVGAGDAGAEFLRRAGEYALSINKEYLRLDSSENNETLAKYYENLGFVPVGTCTDGPYKGVRREKKLK